jgi:hypothetical protein
MAQCIQWARGAAASQAWLYLPAGSCQHLVTIDHINGGCVQGWVASADLSKQLA